MHHQERENEAEREKGKEGGLREQLSQVGACHWGLAGESERRVRIIPGRGRSWDPARRANTKKSSRECPEPCRNHATPLGPGV